MICPSLKFTPHLKKLKTPPNKLPKLKKYTQLYFPFLLKKGATLGMWGNPRWDAYLIQTNRHIGYVALRKPLNRLGALSDTYQPLPSYK